MYLEKAQTNRSHWKLSSLAGYESDSLSGTERVSEQFQHHSWTTRLWGRPIENVMGTFDLITCSAVIFYPDWSIGVRSGAFTLCRLNIERQNSILPLGHQSRYDL